MAIVSGEVDIGIGAVEESAGVPHERGTGEQLATRRIAVRDSPLRVQQEDGLGHLLEELQRTELRPSEAASTCLMSSALRKCIRQPGEGLLLLARQWAPDSTREICPSRIVAWASSCSFTPYR
jgi:hypothetical protein